jgi:hypothetical protein
MGPQGVEQFEHRFECLMPGETLVYCVGDLATARQATAHVDWIADRAIKLARPGPNGANRRPRLAACREPLVLAPHHTASGLARPRCAVPSYWPKAPNSPQRASTAVQRSPSALAAAADC